VNVNTFNNKNEQVYIATYNSYEVPTKYFLSL